MMQQVNLLTPELMPRHEPLTLRHLMTVWAGFSVLLLLLTTWGGVDLWRMTADEDAAKEQWQLLRSTNEQLRASFSSTPDPELEASVAALLTEQAERQALMSILSSYHHSQAAGFSGYLEDLSQHSVDGMWLSEIRLNAGGRWIGLKGMATEPGRVPEFLRQLSAGESFDGHLFDGLELEETETGLLEFELAGPEEAG